MNEQPEALRLADEMIEWIDGPAFHVPHYVVRDAAKELRRLHEENQALRQAPSTPEQEPVAWIRKNGFRFDANLEPQDDSEIPLYTAPPKQPEQRPVGTYEGVMEAMLSLRNGTLEQQQVYGHMKDKLLYTAPPHHVNDVKKREWAGLTDEEKNFLMETWIGFRNIEKVIETTDELLRRRTHEHTTRSITAG